MEVNFPALLNWPYKDCTILGEMVIKDKFDWTRNMKWDIFNAEPTFNPWIKLYNQGTIPRNLQMHKTFLRLKWYCTIPRNMQMHESFPPEVCKCMKLFLGWSGTVPSPEKCKCMNLFPQKSANAWNFLRVKWYSHWIKLFTQGTVPRNLQMHESFLTVEWYCWATIIFLLRTPSTIQKSNHCKRIDHYHGTQICCPGRLRINK